MVILRNERDEGGLLLLLDTHAEKGNTAAARRLYTHACIQSACVLRKGMQAEAGRAASPSSIIIHHLIE